MSGERLAVLLKHLVGIAVVRGDDCRAALLQNCVNNLTYAVVNRLNRLYCRVKYACVTYHVAVCKVEDDHIVLAALNCGNDLLCNLVRAHLGLQVVGCNRRRFNEDPVLAFVYLFNAAVEEEGYMSVLLGFCDSELFHAEARDILAHCVGKSLRLERNLNVGHGRVILRHANVGEGEEAVSSLKAVKVGVNQRAGDLTRAVGTEVVENYTVVRLDCRAALYNAGYNKFVGNILLIAVLDRADGALCLNAFAVYHCGVRLFNALPAVVTVHRVVTAHNGGDLAYADFFKLFDCVSHVLCRG